MTLLDEQLEILNCTIADRPQSSPGIDDIRPFYRSFELAGSKLTFLFDATGRALVEGFAAGERHCCPGLGWALDDHGGDEVGIVVEGTSEQLAIMATVWTGAPSDGSQE